MRFYDTFHGVQLGHQPDFSLPRKTQEGWDGQSWGSDGEESWLWSRPTEWKPVVDCLDAVLYEYQPVTGTNTFNKHAYNQKCPYLTRWGFEISLGGIFRFLSRKKKVCKILLHSVRAVCKLAVDSIWGSLCVSMTPFTGFNLATSLISASPGKPKKVEMVKVGAQMVRKVDSEVAQPNGNLL